VLYFSSNFKPEFRNWNKTSYLELEWGIWGHNLNKILRDKKLPESVFAKVDSKRNKAQYCFTSDSLFKYVNQKITAIYNSDHALKKYMILPNDNSIVCTCATCKAAGNTATNASPAIFSFLNKLAKNHKNLSFFTAAYVTVKEIPKFKAAENVGLFYSTIDIQKGIPIEESKYFNDFETDIKRWKKYVNNVYIWDYVVNFDNYFDIYPSIKTTQKNLQLYKKLGVTGVFLHGSEYDYSIFQDLKATIFSKLLWNTDINVDKEINTYFHQNYSNDLANLLSKYYVSIDNLFRINKKELSIYSGINKSIKKYLNPADFFNFYHHFNSFTESNKDHKQFLKLATSLTFLKLDIMRNYGIGEYGFATIDANDKISVKEETNLLLDKLATLSKTTNIKTYNEIHYKIDDYIKSWREIIKKYNHIKHSFYKKPFKVLSKLDEDYTNYKVLNDGAFGFLDYNTNWHISSIDNLTLQIEKQHINKTQKITFSFLQDIKHSIYYPNTIEILDENYKLITSLKLPVDQTNLATKEVVVQLPNKHDKKQLPDTFIIKINKYKNLGKNTLACDEIIFN